MKSLLPKEQGFFAKCFAKRWKVYEMFDTIFLTIQSEGESG
jgi:hypothetical protein